MSDPQAQKLLIKRLCSSMGRMPSTVPSQDIEFYHKLWTAMVPVADELRLDQFFQGEFSEREDQEEIIKGYPPTQDEDGYDGTSAIGVETSSDDDDDSSEVSSDDIDDLLSDCSEVEEVFRECWYDDPVADKALRQTYRAAIRCGPFPTPGNSSLPGLASFTSDLNRKRDEIREEEDDIEAAEAQEAADEAEDDAAFVQESLVEMFHDAAAEFRDAFDIENQRGLGCKRPLTLRLHEEVEALRQVKLRVEQAESSGMQPDVDDIQDVLDGVDDVLDSRDRIERKLSGAIGLLFSTLYFLKQHVPDGQMKDRVYGGIEAERTWREYFEYGDSEVGWADHDDGEQSFSDFVDHLQALEGKLRAFLDELSASDPELHSKRIAFESEETALAEIRCEQRDTRTIINPQAFSLLCQEILQNFSSRVHFSDEALDALQAAAESRVIEGFQKANLVAIHAGRTYVTPRDLHLVNALDTWDC
jgi:histone H3/H4